MHRPLSDEGAIDGKTLLRGLRPPVPDFSCVSGWSLFPGCHPSPARVAFLSNSSRRWQPRPLARGSPPPPPPLGALPRGLKQRGAAFTAPFSLYSIIPSLCCDF